MNIIKDLREGDKVILKKLEDLPKDAKKDEIENYGKFAGKMVTVNAILKRTNDNVYFDIKEDKDCCSFANIFVSAIKDFDTLSTKECCFGVGVIEKVLPREEKENNSNKDDTNVNKGNSIKEKAVNKALLDFIDWIDGHTCIDGTALYNDYLKTKGE